MLLEAAVDRVEEKEGGMEPHSGEKWNWRSQIRIGYENKEAAGKGVCPCQVGMVPGLPRDSDHF